MKKKHIIIGALSFIILLLIVANLDSNTNIPDNKNQTNINWESIKNNSKPIVHLKDEFGTTRRLLISTLAWEDGLHISRNGLNLYCTFLPVDFLSFVQNEDTVDKLYFYKRGPTYGMDLKTNPTGQDYEWIHSEILYTHRNSKSEKFSDWQLSGMSRSVFTEGAPNPIFKDPETIEIMAFTSNDKSPTYDVDIWFIRNTNKNPVGVGKPINDVNTELSEDNPHIERIENNKLILFFDSDNKVGGMGSHDIWYSISDDWGNSWSTPKNDISINTEKQEHQPHLYKSKEDIWYLYYSAPHSDGKLGIFRVKQKNVGDWKNWGTKEVVISAGNTEGIGEPTLTDDGDLAFIVVYKNQDGSKYDRYDADPWILPHLH